MVRMAQIELADGTLIDALAPAGLALEPGNNCVLDGGRNPEYGRVLRVEDHLPDSTVGQRTARVIRMANAPDQRRAADNLAVGRKAMEVVVKLVQASGLPIRLLRHRFSLDGAVLHVSYAAEEKVDARELARAIGQELQVYVSMWQLGVRDAARLAGGLAVCGRPLCCASWRNGFDSVSVKMAKEQGLPVNPMAISGMCGRLKCCLCYELATYRQCAGAARREGARTVCQE